MAAGTEATGSAARVVVTTYGIVRNDAEMLSAIEWRAVVFGEIQYLKNRGTRSHAAATTLDARFKLGLTGTPIENRLEELKHLVDLVLPGYLGSDADFRRRYAGDDAIYGTTALRQVVSPFVRGITESCVRECESGGISWG